MLRLFRKSLAANLDGLFQLAQERQSIGQIEGGIGILRCQRHGFRVARHSRVEPTLRFVNGTEIAVGGDMVGLQRECA